MAEEYRRALVEKDALIDILKAMELELERLSPWAELPKELLGLVLEKLQAPWRVSPLAGGWSGFEGSKHVRLVCSGWRDSHDALVTRLTVAWKTTDEGMWLLVRRFPVVVSVAMKDDGRGMVTDEALRAVSSLTGLSLLTSATVTR